MDTESKERIAKRMARAGVCSRRQAEAMIGQGLVRLNGAVVATPATLVGKDDVITVNGETLKPAQETILYRYFKPAGLVTTNADEKGRDTVFDSLPAEIGRVISVGRLDMNTEGLLLLTNDGALARYLELPSTGWVRSYRARAFGILDLKSLSALKKGLSVEGMHYQSIEVRAENPDKAGQDSPSNHWLTVTLREGKNREVRKALEAVGLQVNRLIRTSYGPFQLGKMPRGSVEAVSAKVLSQSLPKNWRAKI